MGTVGRKKDIAIFVDDTKSEKSSNKSENILVPASAIEVDLDMSEIMED